MSGNLLLWFLLLRQLSAAVVTPSPVSNFVFNGFKGSGLRLDGGGEIFPNGLLRLTDATTNEVGHAFFPSPINFLNSSGKLLSFSTTFVFAIISQYREVGSDGIAFAIIPSQSLTDVLPSQHLGLFNLTSNGDPRNHMIAIELDTIQNMEFYDINNNHVGIDINGLRSVSSAPVSFFSDSSGGLYYQNLSLISGNPMQVWADYDGETMEFNVTIAPLFNQKPQVPLLSSKINLSSIVLDTMYVGFSASTGSLSGSHYILGWSFSMNGVSKELQQLNLPSLPPSKAHDTSDKTNTWIILLPIAIFVFLLIAAAGFVVLLKMRQKYVEVKEDWETEYGPHRFSYRDLYRATKGFSDENILGNGGFGIVYRGLLPNSKVEVAVKRISSYSRQGMTEFVAEITSIGRLRHRNLVQLLGYCRRKVELLLVYDFMPKGSLDKYIFGRPAESLNWSQRFKIMQGIAAGLLYLHEEWEQVVLHRDIKASNVLLDAEFNGKLSDFGLARLHERGGNPQATRVVGTLGYLAPELSRTSKFSTCSDVFGFGAFLLEVACGRTPIELKTSGIQMVLVDWVFGFLKKGDILEARDRKLGGDFVEEEVEMVLKLGLMCSQLSPADRPSMKQVVQYLEGKAPLPEISQAYFDGVDANCQMNRLVLPNTCTLTSNPSSSSESSPFEICLSAK